jgi:hypothetical protein
MFLFSYRALSNIQKSINKRTELYISLFILFISLFILFIYLFILFICLFILWLLHISARQCHHQGATTFPSELLQRQYIGRRQVMERMVCTGVLYSEL